MIIERNSESLQLGSAEIRVLGSDGILYAAPNLIYHYVEAHDYLPPAEFINAVLHSEPELQRFYRQKAALERLVAAISVCYANTDRAISMRRAESNLRQNEVSELYLRVPALMVSVPRSHIRDLAALLTEVDREFATPP